jgi:hypothetical protein
MSLPVINLIILQLIAHFLADFVILNETVAQAKNKHGFSSKHLYIHVLVVIILSYLFSVNFGFWGCSLTIGVTHFIIDGLKAKLIKKISSGSWLFFVDQGIHIIIIFIVTGFYSYHLQNFGKVFEGIKSFLQSTNALIYVLGYLLCLKPSNIIIRQALAKWFGNKEEINDKLEEAGRLIGHIERVLILSFVLMNQFVAIGFLLTAKSILRFREAEAGKMSEYVLLGTLLSFSIAIIIGLSINGILKSL